MAIEVKAVESPESKGVQAKEKELLETHEKEVLGVKKENEIPKVVIPPRETKKVVETPEEIKAKEETKIAEQQKTRQEVLAELKDDEVLSIIEKKTNKQFKSFEELMTPVVVKEQLPEDVTAYLKYNKETGRGFEDYLKLSTDYDKLPADNLIKSYLASTRKGLDSEDIEVLMNDFSYDEENDDESEVKLKKIAKKEIVAKAKEYFNKQKETYFVPLESKRNEVPDEEKKEFDAYKQYTQQAKTIEEQNKRKSEWFAQKTDELFNNEFKGFEFNIDDKKIKFTPSDASELKKAQSTPMNFINKYMDESGMIKDAVGYHKSLAIAMNPEKFAKFFYEQGKADGTENSVKDIKNINMTTHKAVEVVGQGGTKVREVMPDSGRNLKILSKKNK